MKKHTIQMAFPLSLLTTALLAGCVSNPMMPMGMPGDMQEMMRRQQEAMAQGGGQNIPPAVLAMMAAQGGMPGARTDPAPAALAVPAISELALLEQLNQLPAPTGRPNFEKRKTGLIVDGTPLVDPEGSTADFGFDTIDGRITFLVKDGQSAMVVKSTRAGSLGKQVILGRATQSGDDWRFESVTGKKLSGSKILPTPNGVVVVRDATAFVWKAGDDQTKTVTIPEGFAVAEYQNGDIGGTRFVLLEKQNAEEANSLFALANSAKKLVGAGKKEDYVLFGLESGKVYPLNIDVESNKVSQATGCQSSKKTSFGSVNKGCTFKSWDSLYEPDGSPNKSHYYWRVRWMTSGSGPVAIVQENGLREIAAIDLTGGKKVNLFNRALGIAGFTVSHGADGAIGVTAQVGLSKESVSDVVKEIKTRPEASAG